MTAVPSTVPPKLKQLQIDRSSPLLRKRRPWKWWLAALLIVLAALFLFLKPRVIDVQTTPVLTSYPSQQYAVLTASGYVVAQRRAAVATKATGRLVWLNVREGSKVKGGELIAKLDASDVQAAVQSAQVGVQQAQAGVQVAEASRRQAEVERINAEAELQRNRALSAENFISPQALDAVRRRRDAALAAKASANAALAQSQAALNQARSQVAVQKVNADFTEIRAPFDGVVLAKNANVGDIITPFSSAAGSQGAVVTIADMSTLEVEADVSESNLSKAQMGAPVEIMLDALPQLRLRGSVVSIVPTVDRAKATVMTKIRFEKLDERILPEMSAKVTVLSKPATEADQKPVLAVNPQAITTYNGQKVVWRIQNDEIQPVPVSVGRKLLDQLEINGTLNSGEKLVLSPGADLKPGSHVAVVTK